MLQQTHRKELAVGVDPAAGHELIAVLGSISTTEAAELARVRSRRGPQSGRAAGRGRLGRVDGRPRGRSAGQRGPAARGRGGASWWPPTARTCGRCGRTCAGSARRGPGWRREAAGDRTAGQRPVCQTGGSRPTEAHGDRNADTALVDQADDQAAGRPTTHRQRPQRRLDPGDAVEAAALASICASTAISGVVGGLDWLSYVVVVVVVVAGTGMALRALRVPRPLIWLGQVFVLLCLAVTLFTTSGAARRAARPDARCTIWAPCSARPASRCRTACPRSPPTSRSCA